MTRVSSIAILAAVLAVMAVMVSGEMNKGGIPYSISNPNGSEYAADFSAKDFGEYFDVYGEVQTRYSQVYWTRNDPVPLPSDIVERFKGKVMAITGYEIDQVMKTADGDKSIPIYNAYNHHYFAWLLSSDAEVYDMDTPTKMPNPTYTGVRDIKANTHGYPTNIVFKENPGGEFRKSYHGYPSGFAQLLYSPSNWVVEPMQIDTHNRKYNATDPLGYKPSFLPKSIQGKIDPTSGLSPLIECPCSSRVTRTIVNTSQILDSGSCDVTITSADECRAAAESTGAIITSTTSINNVSKPAGCLLFPDSANKGAYVAEFNAAQSNESCGAPAGPFTWTGPLNGTDIGCEGGDTCLPSDSKYGCTGEFQSQCTWDSVEAARTECGKYNECKSFFCTSKYNSKFLCFGRQTQVSQSGQPTGDQAWIKTPLSPITLEGATTSLVNISMTVVQEKATITLTGPDGSWFGAGFNAETMADLPYAIIVDGNGTVSERKLVDHGPGALLQPSVTVKSSAVVNGLRTTVVTRSVAGLTKDHFTIPQTPGEIKMIVAIGSSPTIAYHKARTGTRMVLLANTQSCLCAPKVTPYLSYMNTSTSEYHVYCAPEPRGDMLAQNNPACEMMTYHGGLQCCHHTWFLTDLEQDSLIPPEVDTYYLKFRYYFQEYVPPTETTPASHQHLHHWVYLIDEAVNDYEEVKCEDGTNCQGSITAHLTARDMGLEDIPSNYTGITPLVITPHCHAPSCIRQELYNADTGDLICGVTAQYGHSNAVFDEINYVALPPCIFGHQPGLEEPITLTPDTNIRAIKFFNNTYRHLGQMAQWTGLMIYEQ